MFDKENKNKVLTNIKTGELYKHEDTLLTNSFVEMVNNDHYNKIVNEKNDYQNDITTYINKKLENNAKKEYNPKIIDLYHDGLLVINNEEYRLKDFFIIFDDKLNNFHLKCINPKFKTEEITYNKANRFIDTTSFINLIVNNKTINNKIILDNINSLNTVVNNWDGNLHSEVVETDSIINKKVVEV